MVSDLSVASEVTTLSALLLSFNLWHSESSQWIISSCLTIHLQILAFSAHTASAGPLSSSSEGSIISSGFIGGMWEECKKHGNHTHTLILLLSPAAVVWELGTSLSTSLEVERAPDVSLQRAFQHNIIDVSASTPFSPIFFPLLLPLLLFFFFILCVTDCEKSQRPLQ